MLNDIEKRIIEISYKLKLTHISAYLTACNLIDGIYSAKKKDEPFILSQGHAFAALAVVLEKYEGKDAENYAVGVKQFNSVDGSTLPAQVTGVTVTEVNKAISDKGVEIATLKVFLADLTAAV